MALWINYHTIDQIRKYLPENYSSRLENDIKNNYGGTYQYASRKILMKTVLIEANAKTEIGYGYRCIQEEIWKPIIYFCIRSKYLSYKYYSLIESLKNTASKSGKYIIEINQADRLEFRFHCNPSDDENGAKQIATELKSIADTFDPLISKWEKEQEDRYYLIGESVSSLVKSSDDLYCCNKLTFYQAVPLFEVNFGALSVPPYQRTYKWGIRQVNQLINDILLFTRERNSGKCKAQMYHLGTLVINNGDIVDGQQRLVTISLLLYVLSQNKYIREYAQKDKIIEQLFPSLKKFFEETKYQSLVARKNIANNYRTMLDRSSDMDIDFFKTLVYKCQFAIVVVPSRSESFQFFDAQNARGCELEPHDLLKAFHLREIPDIFKSSNDYSRLITSWQAKKSKELARFFLCVYRIRKWGKGDWASLFSKDDVSEFKGVSFGNGDEAENYPFYAQAKLILSALNGDTKSFPFQIDGAIINGQTFFDFVINYYDLYEEVMYPEIFKSHYGEGEAYKLLCRLEKDDKKNRTGDAYVRDFFNASLMYYLDKFGNNEIDKAIFKLFTIAYSIRLTQSSVSLATIDKAGFQGHTIFKALRNAKSPYDILNLYIESIKVNNSHILQSKIIVDEFINLGKIIEDGE